MATFTSSGEPITSASPQYDLPIVSNNGAIKYSANICNVNEQTALIGYYISSSGVVTADANNWIYQDYIPVKPNTTYTLTMSSSVYYVTISEYSTADDSGFITRKAGSSGDNTTLTITTGSTTNFVRFGANIYRGEVTLNTVLAINWMLNVGDTMAYQPYVEGGIYTDGTVETINVHGKNLFDKSTVSTVAPGTFRSDFIRVVPGVVYSMSARGASVIIEYDSEQTQLRTLYIGVATYTPRADAVFAKFNVMDAYLDTFQLERGSTATTYEPYFNGGQATAEMLLKIGNYQDIQSVLDGEVTRNVGIKVLDGTENWSRTDVRIALTLADSRLDTANWEPYCTHYQCFAGASSISSMPDNSCKINANTNVLLIKDATHNTDLATWTQYLADQYNAGTPVTIVYPLAESTTETVTGQHLSIQAGANTVEITQASIDNLPLEVSYKGRL